jgi:hypothetical protein
VSVYRSRFDRNVALSEVDLHGTETAVSAWVAVYPDDLLALSHGADCELAAGGCRIRALVHGATPDAAAALELNDGDEDAHLVWLATLLM